MSRGTSGWRKNLLKSISVLRHNPASRTQPVPAHGADMSATQTRPSLGNLFLSFLKLGATAFGGPAMVPYIGKLAVERKRWINDQTFRDGVALCQTIPGATAMQTAAYVGFKARGVSGVPPVLSASGFPLFFSWLDFQPSIHEPMRSRR
jgi:hypothetical protein